MTPVYHLKNVYCPFSFHCRGCTIMNYLAFWFMCGSNPANLLGSVFSNGAFATQDWQYRLIISISKTFPVSIEIHATAPFKELNPRLCQVPSQETDVSTISASEKTDESTLESHETDEFSSLHKTGGLITSAKSTSVSSKMDESTSATPPEACT